MRVNVNLLIEEAMRSSLMEKDSLLRLASVAVFHENEVCLVKSYKDTKWTLPGGRAQTDEDAATAAARELKEETGITVKPEELVFIGHVHRTKKKVDTIFAVELKHKKSLKTDDEIQDIKWMPVADIPELGFGHTKPVREARKVMKKAPEERGTIIVFEGIDGSGKCFGVDTPILMYDGSIKPVQDVRVGDLVMGHDSSARTVLSLGRGQEMLYKVTPIKGDPFVVNESHTLTLKIAGKPLHFGCNSNHVVELSPKEWLSKSACFKRYSQIYRASVAFSAQNVRIDPYFLGIWLGDGTSATTEVTTRDAEIYNEISREAIWRNLQISVKGVKKDRYLINSGKAGIHQSLRDDFKHYGLLGNKHIPECYKQNDESTRLSLLAGLIDSDGHQASGYFELTLVNKKLAHDIAYVARSVGFTVVVKPVQKSCQTGAVGMYHRISIMGDIGRVPTRLPRKRGFTRKINKSVLCSGIRAIEPVGEGDYYGFTLAESPYFLLGDFTVQHNSTQVDRLVAWLTKHDFPFVQTKWNSSTLLAKTIKKAKKRQELTPALYFLLHAADMTHRYENDLLPALRRNQVVVSDRWSYTGLVRDKIRGVKSEDVYKGLRKPDVVFFCEIDPNLAVARLLKIGRLSYYGAGMDLGLAASKEESCLEYEKRMASIYGKILPKSHKKLKMSQKIDEIYADVKEEMAKVLKRRFLDHDNTLDESAVEIMTHLLG